VFGPGHRAPGEPEDGKLIEVPDSKAVATMKWNVAMAGKRWGAYPPDNDGYNYLIEKTRGSYKLIRRGPRSNSRDNADLGKYESLMEAKGAAQIDYSLRRAKTAVHRAEPIGAREVEKPEPVPAESTAEPLVEKLVWRGTDFCVYASTGPGSYSIMSHSASEITVTYFENVDEDDDEGITVGSVKVPRRLSKRASVEVYKKLKIFAEVDWEKRRLLPESLRGTSPSFATAAESLMQQTEEADPVKRSQPFTVGPSIDYEEMRADLREAREKENKERAAELEKGREQRQAAKDIEAVESSPVSTRSRSLH
jgi:hypothetical protein